MYQYDLFSKRPVTGDELEAAGKPGRILAMFAEEAGVKVEVCAYLVDPAQCYVNFVSRDAAARIVTPIIGDGYSFRRGSPFGAASYTVDSALTNLFESCANVNIFLEVTEINKSQADYYRIKPTGYLKYPQQDFIKLIS